MSKECPKELRQPLLYSFWLLRKAGHVFSKQNQLDKAVETAQSSLDVLKQHQIPVPLQIFVAFCRLRSEIEVPSFNFFYFYFIFVHMRKSISLTPVRGWE